MLAWDLLLWVTRLVSETHACVRSSWKYLSDIFTSAANGYKLAMKEFRVEITKFLLLEPVETVESQF